MDLPSCALMSILVGDSYAIGNAKVAEVKHIKYDSSDVDNM